MNIAGVRIILVTALCLMATSVSAQDYTARDYAPYVALVAGNVADLVTTQQAFSRGAVEGNGIISGQPIVTLAISKACATFAEIQVMRLLEAHHHPRAAKVIGYLIGGVTFTVAVHNTRVNR